MKKTNSLYRICRGKKLQAANAEDLLRAQDFLQFNDAPKGKIGILCIHGFGSTPDCFRYFTQYFFQLGYSVGAPRLPGYGTQPSDLFTLHWQDWLQKIADMYEQMLLHCEHVYLIGQSLGACLALQLAYQKNISDKMYLLSPAVYPPLLLPTASFLKFSLGLFHIRYFPSIGGDIKKEDGYDVIYSKMPLTAYVELYRCIQATQKILQKIHTPVLIFNPTIDHLLRTKDVKKLFSQLGSVEKEVVWLKNSYHVLSVDNEVDFIIARIQKDLSDL